MTFLHNLPIKRKLQAVTLMTCAAALALACTALFWFQSVQFRKGFAEEMESLASIIAHNSSATLAFDDKKSGAEVLAALKVKPHITAACMYDSNGKLFAHYGNINALVTTDASPAGSVAFARGFASLDVPIKVTDAKPGKLRVLANYSTKHRELLGLYTMVLSCVVVSSLLLILLLASRLQRIITDPIIRLAEMAGTIANEEDYSVRAPDAGDDEVGQLTETFNRMLDQIEERDAVLRESEERFRAVIENAYDGIYIQTDGQFAYLNPAGLKLFGAKSDQQMLGRSVLDHVHPDERAVAQERMSRLNEAREHVPELSLRLLKLDGTLMHVEIAASPFDFDGQHGALVFVRDVTARKASEAELARLHRELVTASRQAGMAEVAIAVLHNVGNVLNSVNVSATLLGERLRNSRASNLRKATVMLREQNGHMAAYLTEDPKGKLLPEYFATVAEQLVSEQGEMLGETVTLVRHIEHMREIVATQQNYARAGDVTEAVLAQDLVEDAVKMTAALYATDRVEVVRELTRTPALNVDRHKVLQILVNLLKNSKSAMDLQQPKQQRVVIKVGMANDGHVKFAISDNGIGITAENQRKLFHHGFTTKKDGHGFGLHSAANAAKEMGGRVTAFSGGAGAGASFTLELPPAKETVKAK